MVGLQLEKLTVEQIKHIALLISGDDFEFSDSSIAIHTDKCIELNEPFIFSKQQQIRIYQNGKVLRREYVKEGSSYYPRPICNVIELGRYLEVHATNDR